MITVAAFYKFTPLPGFRALQDDILGALQALGAKGSLLLAEEGLNGTLAAPEQAMSKVIETVRSMTGADPLECKFSSAQVMPFKRLKVRLKREIVTIGNVKADPNVAVGTYVEPEDWNALISDPDTIVIDTRNSYEFRIGTFKKAIDPQTEHFSAFPDFVRRQLADRKDARIAMFCTGGIRCEKATSFMMHEGFSNVFHLKGGILKYLENVPKGESLWEGDCFVFDERVAVGHGLAQSDVTMCYGCLEPVTPDERKSPQYEEGVCCPRCAPRLSEQQKQSNRERQRQVKLAITRKGRHLGPAGPG